MTWTNQTCSILGEDTEDSLTRTWLNEILEVSPQNKMSFFLNPSSKTHRNPAKETYLIQNLELILQGSSQMTSAQRCLYPFHPHGLRSSFTIITASLSRITGISGRVVEREVFFPLISSNEITNVSVKYSPSLRNAFLITHM